MAQRKSKSRSKVTKRAQNALEIAEKELAGYDSEVDEEYDSNRNGAVVNLLKRVEGNRNDEADQDSFEDEELDSDEALGSADEYDVMNSKLSQTIRDSKKKSKTQNTSVTDDEGGYTSIDEADLIPLSKVWDMDDKEDNSGLESDAFDGQLDLENDSLESSSSENSSLEESAEEDEDAFDEISEDEGEVELNTITAHLLKETESRAGKRLNNYGSGKDSEYGLPSLSSNNGTKKLDLADMMSVVEDKEVAANVTLIDSNASTINVPLPQRIQERHNRKAAYEISKQEVEKWKDAVQQNRRAEHLSFPMNTTVEHNHASTFTRSSDKPQTELQQRVDSVLKESNLVEEQKNSTFEDLATAKLSPEEMKKRTTEMRLMRELMFREERKSKRLKKIKSKTYRRIKKKEMLRNKELAEVSEESDEDRDAARAKERMTLKHKANSRWAKDMIKHGMSNDADTREEIEEMLRQGERLKEKILDRGSDDHRDVSLSDIEREENSVNEELHTKKNIGKTGVMGMAFMRNAEARDREANIKTIAKLRSLENDADADAEVFESDEEGSAEYSGKVQLNKGRRIYTPGELKEQKSPSILEVKNVQDQITHSNATQLKDGKPQLSAGGEKSSKAEDTDFNPWLDRRDDGDESLVVRSSKVSIVDKDSSKMTKRANKIEKVAKDRQRGIKDEDLLLNLEDTNRLNIVDPYGGSDNEGNSFMFKQQEFMAEAFAGDDVVQTFEEEKEKIAIDEDDKEQDVTLPGWGEWAGAGANPKKKRKFVKKIKGVAEKDKRRDKNLKNVIINERVNKKNLKYQSSAVPFPFENKEQYERSLRMPIGQEWTSRSSHQKLIKPRILTKSAHVIDPLKAPFK